jgi:hypothetical protein
MGVDGQCHAPAALSPGKRLVTHCTGGCVAYGPVWTVRKISPPPGFFFLPFRGFSPLIHFCTVLYPFVLHVTFYVPCYRPYTTNTTQTSMPPAGFKPTIPVSERPQTHALDRTATGIGFFDPRTVQPVASCYTDWAIPAHLHNKKGSEFIFLVQTEEIQNDVTVVLQQIIPPTHMRRTPTDWRIVYL